MEKQDLLKQLGWSNALLNNTEEVSSQIKNGTITQKIKFIESPTVHAFESSSTISFNDSDITSRSNVIIK